MSKSELHTILSSVQMSPVDRKRLVNYLNNASPAALKKSIKSKYRFMDISNHEKYNTEVVEGIIGNNYNTLYLNDKLIAVHILNRPVSKTIGYWPAFVCFSTIFLK